MRVNRPTSGKIRKLIFLCCVLLHGAIGIFGTQEQSAGAGKQPISAAAQAKAALASGNPGEAIRVLSAQVQTHPEDISARLVLAQAYVAASQDDRAQEQYELILQAAPENYSALAGLGEIYERAGDPTKAEVLLTRAAKLSHGDAQIRTAWAAVLARQHRYAHASRTLAGVPAPTSVDAGVAFHRLKAAVALGLGNAEAAASEMEKALALRPSQAGLEMATAAADLQARHWKRVEALSRSLLARTHDANVGLMLLEAQLNTNDDVRPTLQDLDATALPADQESRLRERMVELLVAHEHFPEAAEELKSAVELEPSRADLRFNLALAQFRAKRLDDALATAETLQASSDSAELEDLLGDIQEARGDNLASVHSYEAAVALAPNQEKYRISLALELMRHKSFEPARVVLKQAEELHPDSWRIQFALGMVEYFAGSLQEAIKVLLNSAAITANPEPVLEYVGQIEIDETGAPDSAAVARICEYGQAHLNATKIRFYCAALRFHRNYAAHDTARAEEIVRDLNASVKALPHDASPHCQLGKAYRWLERWQDSLRESEMCARMEPNSADAHYRLAQIYQHVGQQRRSQEEMKLYEASSSRLADENARRDETIKTFLYSIQKEPRDHR
ncbi:MAG: tetratricopeptide repeat protein [Terriglobales bacterium]